MDRRTFLTKCLGCSAGLYLFPPARNIHSEIKIKNKLTENRFPKNLRILELHGSPGERGRIHGETLRSEIKELTGIWKDDLGRSLRSNPDKYIEEFVNNTNFLKAMKKWTPGLVEEVKGISEGSGIDYQSIYAFQMPDEEWWFGRERRIKLIRSQRMNCSCIGAWGQDGYPALIAQNMDIPQFFDGYQVLKHIKYPDSDFQSYVFSVAGLIALNGMNNHSVGVCVNAILQLDNSKDGLPVAYVNRGILDQKNFNDAVNFVRNIKHASGQNYVIGGKDRVRSFECSANKVVEFLPFQGAKRVYHTNHPVVNDDKGIYEKLMDKYYPEYKKKSLTNSEIRQNFLQSKLKDESKNVTAETVKSILGSHEIPICFHKRPGAFSFTAGCTIMLLSSEPEFLVAPGPGCSTEFEKYKY
ncbi:C45 family autoproteolytic acyltransferase/hydrolase [candidate division KSB1 bacterium]